MLAKLRTFSLVGIEAVPVEVEVDVSAGGLPKTVLVGLARGGGQGEHASRRTGAGQLGLSAAARSGGHQSGPGRTAQAGRLVRSADHAGHAGRQRADHVARSSTSMPSSANWPSTAPRGRPRAPCRWPSPPRPSRACAGWSCPRASAAEAAVVEEHRDHRRQQPGPGRRLFHRPDRHRADAAAARRMVSHLFAIRRRLCRRPRPGDGQAGHHHRRRRQPQSVDARSARLGQDDAGQAAADDLARADAGRIDRDHADLQRHGPAAAPASRCWPRGPIARRITRSATPAWSAADRRPRRAKSRSATTAFCFSTNCPSSIAARWKCCASRWKTAR